MVKILKSVNLFITDLCNRYCPFCDVKNWITHEEGESHYMSLEDIRLVINWLKQCYFNTIQLVGGEPMLHPNIVGIVREAVRRNVHIGSILTNGLADTKLYEEITSITNTMWVVNVVNPKMYSSREWELLNRNLEVLKWKGDDKLIYGRTFDFKILLLQFAVTFFQSNQDYRYIIEMAKKYDCASIRYDVSHPSSDKSNVHLDFKGLVKVKPVLMRFLRDCVNEGIKPHLDCVLPPCIFTSKEMRFLILHASFKSVCYPCLDVMPNLRVEYCTSMRGILPSYSIEEMKLTEIVKNHLTDARELIEHLLPRCRGCPHFMKGPFPCQGFCLRFKANKINLVKRKKQLSILGRIFDFIS